MKKFILCSVLFLSACTLPVKQEFPSVPKTLMEQPVPLKVVPENSSFSVMLDTMLDNYSSYYVISQRLSAWQEWYNKQKSIFEKAK